MNWRRIEDRDMVKEGQSCFGALPLLHGRERHIALNNIERKGTLEYAELIANDTLKSIKLKMKVYKG